MILEWTNELITDQIYILNVIHLIFRACSQSSCFLLLTFLTILSLAEYLISIDLMSHSFKLKSFVKAKYIPETEIETGTVIRHLYFTLFIYSHIV